MNAQKKTEPLHLELHLPTTVTINAVELTANGEWTVFKFIHVEGKTISVVVPNDGADQASHIEHFVRLWAEM